MGITTILDYSDSIIIFAFGNKKSNIVKKLVEGEITSDIPASFMKLHQNSLLVLDKESSSLL